jgi:hypothetical protein
VSEGHAHEADGDTGRESFPLRGRIPDPHAFLEAGLLLLEALMPDAAVAEDEVRSCRM